MARKTIEINLEDRGNPLTFVIKEMPATKLEAWIARALILAAGSGNSFMPDGVTMVDYISQQGTEAIARIVGALDYDKAKPLLDELLGCCYRKLEGIEERCTPDAMDGYIEDVSTLFRLRMEAIKLNLGFLQAEVEKLSSFREEPATATN